LFLQDEEQVSGLSLAQLERDWSRGEGGGGGGVEEDEDNMQQLEENSLLKNRRVHLTWRRSKSV
jgi:hypothetical protein